MPYYYALADAFTICDGYHCSVFGPTYPNRYYLMTGTIDPDGQHGGPATDNDERKIRSWETYPERLERAGISWRVYHDWDDYGCNVLQVFHPVSESAARIRRCTRTPCATGPSTNCCGTSGPATCRK